MKSKFIVSAIINSIFISFVANSFLIIREFTQSLFIIVPVFIISTIFAGTIITYVKNKRFLVCQHGTILLYSFYVSIILSTIYHIVIALKTIPDEYMTFIWSVSVCFGVNFIVFWVGIICVYLTSSQIGIKWRIIGVVCGLIPVVNLIVLFILLKATTGECMFEAKKDLINKQRKGQKVCATKYPVLLVHGVFFRDFKFFNYWGRIPNELKANGAVIFYGNHSSAASIQDSAKELKARIEEIITQTHSEKVNIIAHSKGGLDCRYAISKLGIGDKVASLTTINTPHKGCLFADYLLTKIPEEIKNTVADTYNKALKKLGEKSPDFIAAVNDLTDSYCKQLDKQMGTPEGIFCQSVGSILPKAKSGRFPLNFSYHLVKYFDGENDGLVSENSFKWGEKYTLLKPGGKQGISHSDIIDLNRQNIDGFDVREFYVNLVSDLKNRGL